MANRKFTLVRERPVGTLTPALQKRWNALRARRQRLAAAEARLTQDVEQFSAHLIEVLSLDTASVTGLRVGDDGTLFQVLCGCPNCQALLQGLSIAVTVTEMHREGLITSEQAREAMTRAKMTGASKTELLN